MLRLLLTLSLLLLPAFCQTADEKAVDEAERGWAKGVASKDYALLDKVLATDLVYTHSNGAVDGKASYIDNLKTGKSNYKVCEHEKVEVKMLDKNTALTMCRLKVEAGAPGKENKMNMSVLHVFRKNKGQWQMVAHQSARLP